MSNVFSSSENSGGHDHEHVEVEQVSKMIKYLVHFGIAFVLHAVCYVDYIDII